MVQQVTKPDDLSLIPGTHIAGTAKELALPRCSDCHSHHALSTVTPWIQKSTCTVVKSVKLGAGECWGLTHTHTPQEKKALNTTCHHSWDRARGPC